MHLFDRASQSNRTHARSVWLFAIACAVLLVALPYVWVRWNDRDRGLGELVEAVTTRLVEPRITGGFRWARLLRPRSGAADFAAAPDLRIAAARLEKALTSDRSAEALHRFGRAQLLLGHVSEALAVLRDALDARPEDADLWCDLAAAHYVLATREPADQGEHLVRALNAATRASRLAPSLPEAWFNLALVQERTAMLAAARESWARHLALERGTDWAQEGRERMAAMRHDDAAARWAQLRLELGNLQQPLAADRLAAFAKRQRQELREWLEDELLGTWASAALAHDEATAALALDRARMVAAALTHASGDPFHVAVVEALSATEKPAWRQRLATGHRWYAQGRTLYDQDRRRDAGALFEQAAQALQQTASPFWAWGRFQQGLIAYHRRDYDETTRALDEVLSYTASRGYRTLWARSRWLQGIVQLQTQNPATALDAYREALLVFEQFGEVENAMAISNASADSLRILGNPSGGWNAMLSALDRVPDVRRPIRRYNVLLNASLFALREELFDASLAFQDAALAEARLRGGPAAPLEGLMRRAVIYQRRHEQDAAERDLDQADLLLTEIVDQAQARYFSGWLDAVRGELLMGSDPLAAREHLTRALPFFELSEPAEVPRMHLLRGRSARASGLTADAARDFEQGIERFEQRRRQLPQNDLRLSYFDEAWQLFGELMDLHRLSAQPARIFRIAEQSRARSLRDTVAAAAFVDLSQVQQRLHADETMLYYAFVADRLVTWTITSRGHRYADRAIDERAIARDVSAYLGALHAGTLPADAVQAGRQQQLSSALFDTVIRPYLPSISSRTSLIIVPDGPLHGLPFGSLFDGRRGRYLIEDHVVILAPSATLWRSGAEPVVHDATAVAHAPSVLLVANPRLTDANRDALPALPEADAEVREIAASYAHATVLRGPDATRSRVLAALPEHAIVHVASHAVANREFPSFSRLVLAPDPGSPGDGALFAYEIASRPLGRTQLVVLAACSTGGGAVQRGEGVLSLARPFLLAGVPTVVASAWDVDDRATRFLFSRFHAVLRGGAGPAAALRAAQLGLLHHADASLRGPHAWGAFSTITTGRTTTLSEGPAGLSSIPGDIR